MRQSRWWNTLDEEDKSILLCAAMAPSLISLDLLIAVTQSSAIKILTLLEQGADAGVLTRDGSRSIGYYRPLQPAGLDFIIEQVDSTQLREMGLKLASFVDSTLEEGLGKSLSLAGIYQVSGIFPAKLDAVFEAAQHFLASNHKDMAAGYFRIILNALGEQKPGAAAKTLFIDSALGLVAAHAYKIPLVEQFYYLKEALTMARELKDRERVVRVGLIYGRGIARRGGDLKEARSLIEGAGKLAKESGVADLIRKSEMVTSNLFHCQGYVAKAVERYEKAIGSLDEFSSDQDDLRNCAVLGWCYGIVGQTARGVGLIGAVRSKAAEMGLEDLKSYADLMEVLTLLEASRISEVEERLKTILEQPEEVLGSFVLWQANSAMAYVLYTRGDLEGCSASHRKSMEYASKGDWLHHRGTWSLDYLEALEAKGLIDPDAGYTSRLNTLESHPDIYARGVAMRHRAKRRMAGMSAGREAVKDARESVRLLETSGACIELARSQIFLARLLLQRGTRSQAKALLNQAWEILSVSNEHLFPKDLHGHVSKGDPEDLLLKTMIEVGNTLGAVRNKEGLLERIVNLVMRLSSAERGAVFLRGPSGGLNLQASRNLDLAMISSPGFSASWKMIDKVSGSGQGIIYQAEPAKQTYRREKAEPAWLLCSPIIFQDRVLGALYLDSTSKCERDLERELALLKALGNQVAVALDNVRAYEEIAALKGRLEQESRFFQAEFEQSKDLDQIVGSSSAVRIVQQQIQRVAPTDSAVLITGETGVGKELLARAIHRLSGRAGGPFIPVNIASLSDGLMPSELFGHEKGAFTGAAQTRAGRFELADQGTLFLDDIQNLSIGVQVKLLRAIQERELYRVGGSRPIKSDFRIIAATNVPLDQMVSNGTFRSDLYYRLKVFPIYMAPLRERPEDIPLLTLHFLELYNKKLGKNVLGVSNRDMKRLLDYSWPGNARELAHVIERAVILSDGKYLNLPGLEHSSVEKEKVTPWLSLTQKEKSYIEKALTECGWRVSGPYGAARLLDVKPTTLFKKMKKLGIERKKLDEVLCLGPRKVP